MAANMTLNLGKIKGESAIKDGEIDISSFSLGGAQYGSGHTATGFGTGKAEVRDLEIRKWLDLSTPALLNAMLTGDSIKEAVLTCRKAAGTSGALEYFKVTLTDCMITGVDVGGSDGEDKFGESLRINFANIKVDYNSQTANQGKGAHMGMSFAVAKDKKA